MYKYILFDLDGTLSDPFVGICTSVQYALKKYGIDVPDISVLKPFIGPPLKDSFMEYYNIPEEDTDTLMAYYRERFSVTGLYENELYEGMDILLKDLKEDGRKLAIASSKPTVFVKKILEYFKIDQYFDVVMGSELNGKRGSKLEVLTEALSLLFEDGNMIKEECVMIGDRKFDIEASNAINVPNIGVSYGYGSIEELTTAGANVIVNSVNELRTELF